jgi:photosystem II stability/assembly factor-like uncharacterized protein
VFSRSALSAGIFSVAMLAGVAAPASAAGLAAQAARPMASGGQVIRQVWPIGATSAWAWTGGELTGSPQGLERTVNGGKTWATVTPAGLGKQTGNHFISGLYALDATHAWVTYGGVAMGAAQTIAMTADGGRHWTAVGHEPLTKVSFSPLVYGCGLDFVTPQDGWCETTPAFVGSEAVYIYRTTDSGRQWQLVSKTPGPPPDPAGSLPFGGDKDTRFATPRTGWTVFAEAGAVTAPLYETVNGGKTWVKRQVAKAPGTFDGGSEFTGQPLIAGSRGAVGYTIAGPWQRGAVPADSAPGAETVVYVTSDGGLKWHAVIPPGKPTAWVVDAITPLSWRLVAGNRILATDNAGKTWQTITSNVSLTPLYSYDDPTAPVVNFANSQAGWVVGTSVTGLESLWRTADGGRTWRRLVIPGT